MSINRTEKKFNVGNLVQFILISILIALGIFLVPEIINKIVGREVIKGFAEIEIIFFALVISLAISVQKQLKEYDDVLDGGAGWLAMVVEKITKNRSVRIENKKIRMAEKAQRKEDQKKAKALAAEENKGKPKSFTLQNRVILLVVVVLSFISSFKYPAIMPHVQLPGEQLTKTFFTFLGQDFGLTNTMLATITVYVFLLIIGYSIFYQYKSGKSVLTGIGGVFVMLFEMLYDMSITSVGEKHAKKIFPLFGTIFIVVMAANVMELLPGVDSIGKLHIAEHEGNAIVQVTDNVHFLVVDEADATATQTDEEKTTYGLYPFLRAAATDLNFTLAIAIVSMISVQIYGFSNLGIGYATKFWNVKSLREAWKKPQFGGPLNLIKALIDWVVGLLEMVSEMSKVISFTFRLFGVIFAGQVLLFVVGSIIPYMPLVVEGPFYLIEMFFGVLQAFVFGMLTMVFMKIASTSHDHDEDAHES
jgi:F-type H+-transporting ATPase subunit a